MHSKQSELAINGGPKAFRKMTGKAEPKKTYACPVCDTEFDTKAKVIAHQKAAHKEH